jgi:hypothetical protein
MGTPSPRREEGAAAAVEVITFIGIGPAGRGIARAAVESNVTAPAKTSHAQGRENSGITNPASVDANVPLNVRFRF